MRLAVAAIARSTFDIAFAEEIATSAFEVLGELGAELIGTPTLLQDGDSAQRAAAISRPSTPAICSARFRRARWTDAGSIPPGSTR